MAVAIVTGASSGIGEATAVALAREGYSVALAARRGDRINEIVQRISGDGGRALAVPTDVADEGSANELIRVTREELGSVDVLVNNAGVMLLGPVQGADTEEWRRMVDVNVLGLMYCSHAALPVMQEQGGGHIVNVSSVAGRTARMGAAGYNATKWAVVAFTEALRQEALHSKIRVSVVEPGFVETELQGHNENPMVVETIDKMRAKIGDILKSEDIADAIVYMVTRPPHVLISEIMVRPTGE
ncbi:MAG: SDR family oxidoreductase [Thermoleophilaceae bacterium]